MTLVDVENSKEVQNTMSCRTGKVSVKIVGNQTVIYLNSVFSGIRCNSNISEIIFAFNV